MEIMGADRVYFKQASFVVVFTATHFHAALSFQAWEKMSVAINNRCCCSLFMMHVSAVAAMHGAARDSPRTVAVSPALHQHLKRDSLTGLILYAMLVAFIKNGGAIRPG